VEGKRHDLRGVLTTDDTESTEGFIYRDEGCGFLEAAYQEHLAKEFRSRGIVFLPCILCFPWLIKKK